jgi:outer membrane protein assembly factor BamB
MSQAPSGSYKFDIVCIDRNNGKTIWQRTVKEELPHEGHHRDNSFASYSPVTDGKFIWASFGSRGVYCYDMQGNQKWCKDLGPMKTRAGFGEGTSPCLAGNALIVVMDQENQSNIYALNKNTGDIIWQKKRDELTSWSTPVPVEVDGKLQVISSASNFIRSYDAKTGNIVWQCSGQTANVIPTPVIGFDMVICMSGYRGNAVQAIKLNAKGDVSGTDAIVWEVDDGTPYVPSPLLYGDKLYFGSSNRAIISCYNAKTGKPHFVEQDLDEMSGLYASPVGAADRVYIAGRGGMTTVIKNSDKFEPLATNKLDDNFDASPVIIGDNIYLKGKANIYCIAKP